MCFKLSYSEKSWLNTNVGNHSLQMIFQSRGIKWPYYLVCRGTINFNFAIPVYDKDQ